MNDGFLRNAQGRITGRFDGNWLRDGTGKLVARYDAGDNRTRDATGRIVGNGDLRLLKLGNDHPDKVFVAGGVFC